MIKIKKYCVTNFLLGYIAAIVGCELMLMGYDHSFGIIGFLLLFDIGIMIALLWGWCLND